jgi:hypothetical protein
VGVSNSAYLAKSSSQSKNPDKIALSVNSRSDFMRLRTLLSICALVSISSANPLTVLLPAQAQNANPPQVPATISNPGKPLAPPATQDKLKFFGQGWEAGYNQIMDSWDLTKYVPNSKTGGNDSFNFWTRSFDNEMPSNAQAFATKLKTPNFFDYGSVWTVTEIAASDNEGFLIRGIQKDIQSGKTMSSFILLRTINGQKILFQPGSSKVSEAMLQEMIAVARSARL